MRVCGRVVDICCGWDATTGATQCQICAITADSGAMRLPCPALLDSHRGDPYTPSLAQAAISVCLSTIGFDLLGVLDA